MKKRLFYLTICAFALLLAACGSSAGSGSSSPATASVGNANTTNTPQSVETVSQTEQKDEKVLVAYFAFAENIGDTSEMSVDAIASASLNATTNTMGNLQLMAGILQNKKDADVFHIVVQEPYAPQYEVMHDRAIDEINKNILPALTDKVENLEQYDIVYLGTPVWSGSLPQPVVSFLKENDLSGKTVIPFGVNLGSSFDRIEQQLRTLCPNATVTESFTVQAATPNKDVETSFDTWLNAGGAENE